MTVGYGASRATVPGGVATVGGPREEGLSPWHFSFLVEVLYRESGLALGPDKEYLVRSRLSALASSWGTGSLNDLLVGLRTEQALPRHTPRPITLAVCDALTTNETLFFRDAHPFLALRDVVLPAAAARRRATASATATAGARPDPIRIWCAAASTGQEPYSVAMCAALAAPRLQGVPVEILATDYSPRVLQRARDGVYSEFEARRGLSADHLARFFVPTPAGLRVSDALRAAVKFERRNLLQPFGDLGTFDVVFCRNVLIYFDVETKANVLNRMVDSLRPDGLLFLGGTETALGITPRLRRSPRSTSMAFERAGE